MDVNIRDKLGRTSLMEAADDEAFDMIWFSIKNEADVKGEDGEY